MNKEDINHFSTGQPIGITTAGQAPKQDDEAVWRESMIRDIGIGGTINISRAEDYSKGWNAATAYARKSDDRLKEAVKLLDNMVGVALHLLPYGIPIVHSAYGEIQKAKDFVADHDEQEVSSER